VGCFSVASKVQRNKRDRTDVEGVSVPLIFPAQKNIYYGGYSQPPPFRSLRVPTMYSCSCIIQVSPHRLLYMPYLVRNSAGGKRVGYYDSLESVHNSLHVWIGGGGQMVSSNVILIPSDNNPQNEPNYVLMQGR
jgi:hypothetical protein